MEKISHQTEQERHHELLPPSQETLSQLENLEKDAHLTEHKKQIEDELLSKIDRTDGLDAEEKNYIHIVEDFFDNFLDDW
ncbi:MAG: hypothetical protein H6766_00470 [Candidatus Peribacteria bacterium]|nr:MAG: hypothetical protein H6766_00470 [Candidatus Peribacteria bacterium]